MLILRCHRVRPDHFPTAGMHQLDADVRVNRESSRRPFRRPRLIQRRSYLHDDDDTRQPPLVPTGAGALQ